MINWKTCLLSDEIELAYGKALPEYARVEGCIPVFGSNGVIGYHNTSLVSGPGIIVGRKGSVGEVTYSSIAFWPIDTSYFVVNKGNNNWKFLFYLLQNLELRQLNRPSPVPGLNRQDVYSVKASFPPLEEQEKIVSVIDCIEHSIDLHNRKILVLKELSNALLHKFMMGEVRVGDFDISALVRPADDVGISV